MTAPAPAPLGADAAATATDAARRLRIHDTAQKFEASFLSVMLQQAFEGVNAEGPFGGGPGETMFKSFLTEAMAKQTTRAGGVGIAAHVEREMLKMQGLT